jgi:biotin-dependent carboxylase-like uncharacterized protein
MARCTLIDAGFFTSIQDKGRLRARDYGVPHSGAMDLHSAAQANTILGNAANTPVLEMTMIGGTFMFSEPTRIAITGALCEVAHGQEKQLTPCVLHIKTGDVVSMSAAKEGNFMYLAISGGFQAASYLDSASYFPGLVDTASMNKGSFLLYQPVNATRTTISFDTPNFKGSLKAYRGAEFYLLNRQQQEQLLSKSFTVSKNWNRMAFQLVEPIVNDLNPMPSSPVIPGTVQLTPSGKLIVLMRDAQTTGGYPRVLQLTEESINELSQRTVGMAVDFVIG